MEHIRLRSSIYTVCTDSHTDTVSRTPVSRRLQRNRQRRKFLLFRRLFFVMAAVAAAVFITLILTGFSDPASPSVSGYKYYTAVTVQCDDTLWDLASAHMTDTYPSVQSYIREIKKVNNMKNDTIYYGQKLILPYYSTELK